MVVRVEGIREVLPRGRTQTARTASTTHLASGSGARKRRVRIHSRATTPPRAFDLSSDANCLGWFYSHIVHPPRPQVDPWDALELDDIPRVDVTLPSKWNSAVEFLTGLDALGARKTQILMRNQISWEPPGALNAPARLFHVR